MSTAEWAVIIQTASVVVALLGVASALVIAIVGNRRADRRAEADRTAARREAQRRFDLEMLTRLSINFEHGGSSDPAERKRLGAEAGALLTILGPERLPLSYATHRGGISRDEIRQYIEDNKNDPAALWRCCANEVALALDSAVSEARASTMEPQSSD